MLGVCLVLGGVHDEIADKTPLTPCFQKQNFGQGNAAPLPSTCSYAPVSKQASKSGRILIRSPGRANRQLPSRYGRAELWHGSSGFLLVAHLSISGTWTAGLAKQLVDNGTGYGIEPRASRYEDLSLNYSCFPECTLFLRTSRRICLVKQFFEYEVVQFLYYKLLLLNV